MGPHPEKGGIIIPILAYRLSSTLRKFGIYPGVMALPTRGRFDRLGERMLSIKLPVAVTTFWEKCKKYAAENPAMAITILALVVTCALPVTIFLSFALTTLFVTLVGFVCIEGTIIGIASIILGNILLVITFFTLASMSWVLLTYYVVSKVYTSVMVNVKPQGYLVKMPLIGYLFMNTNNAGVNGDIPQIPIVPVDLIDDEGSSEDSLVHVG